MTPSLTPSSIPSSRWLLSIHMTSENSQAKSGWCFYLHVSTFKHASCSINVFTLLTLSNKSSTCMFLWEKLTTNKKNLGKFLRLIDVEKKISTPPQLLVVYHIKVDKRTWFSWHWKVKFFGSIQNVPKIRGCQKHIDFELSKIEIPSIELIHDSNGLALNWWHRTLGYTFKKLKPSLFGLQSIQSKLRHNFLPLKYALTPQCSKNMPFHLKPLKSHFIYLKKNLLHLECALGSHIPEIIFFHLKEIL